MEKEKLIELTAEIVAANVNNANVPASDVATMIGTVFGALLEAGSEKRAIVAKPKPAVPVRASVMPDAVTCLECGVRCTMLKRHLQVEHGLTAVDYRKRWSLPPEHPLTAPNYTQLRKKMAINAGLGRKQPPPPVKAQPRRAKAG